ALGRIIADISNHDALVLFLQGLGRDHRKFGTLAAHYPAVGASLLATPTPPPPRPPTPPATPPSPSPPPNARTSKPRSPTSAPSATSAAPTSAPTSNPSPAPSTNGKRRAQRHPHRTPPAAAAPAAAAPGQPTDRARLTAAGAPQPLPDYARGRAWRYVALFAQPAADVL